MNFLVILNVGIVSIGNLCLFSRPQYSRKNCGFRKHTLSLLDHVRFLLNTDEHFYSDITLKNGRKYCYSLLRKDIWHISSST
ncbi:MAG: hypothetical protein ACOYJX_09335 [Acutalibacteraceae bacterium]